MVESEPPESLDADEREGQPDAADATVEDGADATAEDAAASEDAGASEAAADTDDAGTEDGGADEPAPDSEPRVRADREALMARYLVFGGPVADALPWSWSSLPPAEVEALVEVVDGFADSYNAVWAQTDDDAVPPCWHRHPALAHDLSALAWAYYQAYRDPRGTPDLALAFQAQLPGFRDRMDYWLGADPAACRAGRHSRSAQRSRVPAANRSRDSAEEQDAVVLLGTEDFGFPMESSVAALDAELSAG